MEWIQTLLELPTDILIEIFKRTHMNYRLINLALAEVCKQYELPNTTNIFESVNILEYGSVNGYTINQNTMTLASKYGNLDVMKWLRNKYNLSLKNETFNGAVSSGFIENINWLVKCRCIYDEKAYFPAIKNNDLYTI